MYYAILLLPKEVIINVDYERIHKGESIMKSFYRHKLGIVSIVVLCMILAGCTLFSDRVTSNDSTDYEKLLASDFDGNIPNTYGIFPQKIPDAANVEQFYYEYYNPWDACFLIFLCLEFDTAGYEQELTNLHSVVSSHELSYGTTGFEYPLEAVHASNKGMVYALSDQTKHRVVYVLIQFDNYFTDIDYTKYIPKEYLPIGFDATNNNSTRKAFDDRHEN